jgi:hypothetical protein
MKREMVTKRAMVTATRVAGNKEGDGKGGKGDSNSDKANGDRDKVVGDKEGDGKGSKGNSNGNEDGGRCRGQYLGW